MIIALYAWGMVYQSAYLFQLNLPYSFYGFVVSGTLCSYNFHWIFTPAQLPDGATPKLSWHQKYKGLHWLLVLTSLVASGYFLWQLQSYWLLLLASALFTFLYSAPKIPFFPFNRLKKIAYGKTVFLALAWMHITTMLPLLIAETKFHLPHYLFCLHRYFLIYAICILFDLRDQQKDRLEGIKSMITQMSRQQVSLIYYGILVCFFVVTFWMGNYTPLAVMAALLVPGLILTFFYRRFARQSGDYLYYFLLDGLMVISLPLMLIFQF